MSFLKKTWLNRQVEFPNRRKLTATGNLDEFDVSRSEGIVSNEGDCLDAVTMNDLVEINNQIQTTILHYSSIESILQVPCPGGQWTKILNDLSVSFTPGIYDFIFKHDYGGNSTGSATRNLVINGDVSTHRSTVPYIGGLLTRDSTIYRVRFTSTGSRTFYLRVYPTNGTDIKGIPGTSDNIIVEIYKLG